MRPGETIFRSPLDKPLDQLTEDDISQLTREDCRRYLKEKGMRRPSWNKSQAIQQVISLKTLLESRTDSDTAAGIRQKIPVSGPENPPRVSSNTVTLSSEKVTSPEFQISVSADESVSYRRKDPPKPAFSGDVSCRPPVPDNTTSPRLLVDFARRLRCQTGSSKGYRQHGNTGATNGPVNQMTIFYGGKVNVYDGMPADKAQAIMQLAARPIYFPQDTPSAGTAAVRPFPCRLQVATIRTGAVSPSAGVSPTTQNVQITESSRQYREEGTLSREVEPEGPTSRKASLQRYLEKRKDRGRFKIKRKIGGSSSYSLEMYLNHQVRGQNPNEQSSGSGTCSPPRPRPPLTPTRCSSVEKQAKNIGLSVDLNNDVQEA